MAYKLPLLTVRLSNVKWIIIGAAKRGGTYDCEMVSEDGRHETVTMSGKNFNNLMPEEIELVPPEDQASHPSFKARNAK